jgi:hypothetical protein
LTAFFVNFLCDITVSQLWHFNLQSEMLVQHDSACDCILSGFTTMWLPHVGWHRPFWGPCCLPWCGAWCGWPEQQSPRASKNKYFRWTGWGGGLDILPSTSFKSLRQTKWNSVNICDYLVFVMPVRGVWASRNLSYLTAVSNSSNLI